MKQQNYTYILECSDHTFYTGWTNDIKERLKKHNEKKGAKYTKARTPVNLVYLEIFQTKQEAMQREAAIKKLNRKQKEELIEGKHMRRYLGLHKLTENPFLNLYELDALTKDGGRFQYYFASRNSEEELKIRTHGLDSEGIVIFAVTKELPNRVVMIRQYRYPVDDYLYELPAGLVDKGESPEEAAIREMKEETGYHMEIYRGGAEFARRPFFLAQGLTDETSTAVYGYISEKDIPIKETEDSEDIEVILADKEMAKELLIKERLSSRAAFFLMLYLRSSDENPFDFIDI